MQEKPGAKDLKCHNRDVPFCDKLSLRGHRF